MVEVIAGTYEGIKGIARTFTPIEMYNIRLKAEETIKVILPEYYNTGILVIEGTVRVNEKETAPTDHFILFRNEGEVITLKAIENSILLVLSGEPIKEPIVSYGPFLMNTKDEIMKAYKDLNAGKFGQLED